jgi:hypothetical protein
LDRDGIPVARPEKAGEGSSCFGPDRQSLDVQAEIRREGIFAKAAISPTDDSRKIAK